MTPENKNVILENLSELKRRAEITAEQKSITLAQLADSLSRDSDSIEELYSECVGTYVGASVFEKLSVCRALCEIYSIKDASDIPALVDTSLPTVAGSHGKIALVRNLYNDMALARFSTVIPHSKPIYYSNFESSCEAVSSGTCEFTVLPIENTSDGKMFGFYSLMDSYELKIAAVCKIEAENPAKTIIYALVGRSTVSEVYTRTKTPQKIFEFSLSAYSGLENYDIFDAARLSSAKLRSISSIPLAYDTSITRVYYSFALENRADMCAFLLYLSLEFPSHTPIGLFFEI